MVAPLPPRRPADLAPPAAPEPQKPAENGADKPAAGSACIARFEERGGVSLPIAAENTSGECGIEDPVSFRTVTMPDGSKVEFDSAITVRCAFALDIVDWVRDDLSPAAAAANSKLSRLVGVGGHACRPRNGAAGAPISEHASGNAMDLSGLVLQDNRSVMFNNNRDDGTSALREHVQKSACARFTTVLGPGSDSSHKDHLHLDMRRRKGDFKICQWATE